MTGPPAATAAVRAAVRRVLEPGRPAAAAVSGGADSLALAAGLAHAAPGSVALVVDHGLQDASAGTAARAAEQCAGLGLVPRVLRGRAGSRGGQGGQGGPEAAARALRLRLLEQAAGEGLVLLGHTRDDQAETVLLGLARGSGARSLAGMPAARGPFRRPLLGLERGLVRQACAEAGLTPWEDPHNADPSYARSRVRGAVLPVLETALGPGVAAALARTAALLREDADALDALTPDLPDAPECAVLAALPAALRSRALRRWATARSTGAVEQAHVVALRALVEAWRGQGAVALPGGVRVSRRSGRLVADPAPVRSPA